MLQFFWRGSRPARPGCDSRPEDGRRWRADPLSHPSLARMTERELADLPFPPLVWREKGTC